MLRMREKMELPFRGEEPPGRSGGWSRPRGGRTQWARGGCWWTGSPSPRSLRGGRTPARRGRRCRHRGWSSSQCRIGFSGEAWAWRWCQGTAPEESLESVWLCLTLGHTHLAARVILLIPLGRDFHHVPLGRNVEVSEVHRYADAVIGRQLVHVAQIQLQKYRGWNHDMRHVLTHHESIICPAPKLHHALLLIKREELDVNAAVWLVDGRGVPLDPAVPVENGFGHDGYLVVPVSAEIKFKFSSKKNKIRFSPPRSPVSDYFQQKDQYSRNFCNFKFHTQHLTLQRSFFLQGLKVCKSNAFLTVFKEHLLTYYRAQCPAAKCPGWERAGTWRRRSPRGSRWACSLPTPAPPTHWWWESASACPLRSLGTASVSCAQSVGPSYSQRA